MRQQGPTIRLFGPGSGNPVPDADSQPEIGPDSPDRFINRELSWLAFNERVLAEAREDRHPLLERVRFLSISANNLNEFYMVRVAGLKGQQQAGVTFRTPEGLSPGDQLSLINRRVRRLMKDQQECWRDLQEELKAEDIAVLTPDELTDAERDWISRCFDQDILPVLTPIAIDPAHPFPFLPNLGFALVIQLESDRTESLNALVPLPTLLDRFIRMPGEGMRFLSLERLVALHIDRLFPGYTVVEVGICRVLRDSDIEIEEEAEDLVRFYETALKERRRGSVIRLSINTGMSEALRAFLVRELEASPEDVFALDGMIGLADTDELITGERPELMFSPFEARFPERVRDYHGNCFDAIRAKDFVVHHPYESFDVVVQFLHQAARDPDVLAIKQTLYRTSDNSPIVAALQEAAEAGKAVTALVEVKARFDEERNIRWARDLADAGAQVVFGFVTLKTHAKISLVVRREGYGLRSYCHFGTGNYHPVTARIYTDLAYFTCDEALCRDAVHLFNYMTGTARPESLAKLKFSPIDLRSTIVELIEDEMAHARAGRPATIWAKMNSLVDDEIIDALYRASGAGVQIHLVVRGICCLRPSVAGLSDNITVTSIVGRFLEHSRIYCFGAGHPMPSPSARVYFSSADLMPRNLDRRVETLVPVENETVHRQILAQIMSANIRDQANTWVMDDTGEYHRPDGAPDPFSCHAYFMNNPSLSGRGSAMTRGDGDDYESELDRTGVPDAETA